MIGVEGVDAVVLGGGAEYVVRTLSGDVDVGYVQRLWNTASSTLNAPSLPKCSGVTFCGVRTFSETVAAVRALSQAWDY